MDIKTLIKETAYNSGMDMCGVAPVSRFGESLPGRHPTDVLPGCRSVIVVGTRLLDGVVQANMRAFEEGKWSLKGLYGQYGYSILPNFQLTWACYAVAQAIERGAGETATPLSTGPMTNGVQMSIRHSAVAAGLGEFGWMGLVLTPEFGPRNRFGIILTTAEIEPDPMYSGPKLCDPAKCGICSKVCPTGALSAYGDGEPKVVHTDGRTYEYCRLDWIRCQYATQGMTKELGGAADYVDAEKDMSPAELLEATAAMPVNEGGLQHHPSHCCGKCLTYCPAGNWGRKFAQKGLTKGAAAQFRRDSQ